MTIEQATPAVEAMRQVFAVQRVAFNQDSYPSYEVRRAHLLKLKSLVLDNTDAIAEAIAADFGHRSLHETKLLDIFGVITEINHSLKCLKKWMKPRKRGVSIWFQPGRAAVLAQPLGVIGIAAPWNYPLYLNLGPLCGALAAGNRAMIKIASDSSKFGQLIGKLLAEQFPQDLVAVIQPGPGINDHFSRLPFDHLIFTGSPSVGKQIMRNCSENLTPVTLELGGKSPTVVAPEYSIKNAAETILWGKCLNAGQTCVAPDYLFIPEGCSAEFIEHARATVAHNYPGSLSDNPDYTRMINGRQLTRVSKLLEDARVKGARIIPLADAEDAQASGKLAPHLVLDVRDDMQIMQEEIFGPLLPVMTYRSLDEVLAYINRHDRPLAFYYFDDDRKRTESILKKTIAGGVTVNSVLLHVLQENLPFGGVGNSGLGHYHAEEGFQTFSKMKPIFYQAKLNGSFLLKPPFGKVTGLMLKLMLR
ncbi:TPA: coniferyl aldehyde dehydrogenase [Pseudomonas aeruginosa]|nr:coniferyl aldehyde dehydrogenase [Pseudomonas aeruginosa]HCA5868826.1 coniferyl aldehyde dehydrogenase [Pseudomonas aeruginosa]HCA7379603.1 coniferyl aldehyde dehydrogenase [Pseudomonas aeruginosa]HCA7777464.1 coniferyl aldehyde dehydrogenase [Pseudomonas aeruginosa]